MNASLAHECITEYIEGSLETLESYKRRFTDMSKTNYKNSMFLMIDSTSIADLNLVRGWLSGHDLRFYEARDVFDAIDEFCDFTAEDQPDLIIIPSSRGSYDADLAKKMIDRVAPDLAAEVLFLSVSGSFGQTIFSSNLKTSRTAQSDLSA